MQTHTFSKKNLQEMTIEIVISPIPSNSTSAGFASGLTCNNKTLLSSFQLTPKYPLPDHTTVDRRH